MFDVTGDRRPHSLFSENPGVQEGGVSVALPLVSARTMKDGAFLHKSHG